MKRTISIILVVAMLIAVLPAQCFAASTTLLEVTVDNAPIRGANNNKGKVITRCAKGSVLESTGYCINSSLNKWYKVKWNGGSYYIYSGNVKKHVHSYKSLESCGIHYLICDCGDIKVDDSVYTVIEVQKVEYQAAYVDLARDLAMADGPFPYGDVAGLAIIAGGLAYEGALLATQAATKALQNINYTAITDVLQNINFSKVKEYGKREDKDLYTYRAVVRIGGQLKYVDNIKMNIVQAYAYCHDLGMDVYTETFEGAEALAMLGGSHFSEIDKNKPDYFYHFHYGTNYPRYTTGGHIFYGASPSGLIPH